MKHNKIGISDVPCYDRNQDSLDVGNYVRALEKFVLNCTTPMSIALQGDWGTGKTSFLQAMRNDFKQENPEIKTIYFNLQHLDYVFL
jgi:DNA replication protein DnaC